ncbi:TPA: tail fiber assembly protein [Escherichia coli]|nr:tail fiber assembly protein [Escherichia coli]
MLAAWKKYRVLLNHVDTSVAPDIGRTVLPEGQHMPATVRRAFLDEI